MRNKSDNHIHEMRSEKRQYISTKYIHERDSIAFPSKASRHTWDIFDWEVFIPWKYLLIPWWTIRQTKHDFYRNMEVSLKTVIYLYAELSQTKTGHFTKYHWKGYLDFLFVLHCDFWYFTLFSEGQLKLSRLEVFNCKSRKYSFRNLSRWCFGEEIK